MKDIHSHLLYGIDDGSRNIDESINLLKQMVNEGVDSIIFTPHYIENSKYNCNNKDKMEIFRELKKRAEKEKIAIKMYFGNEVFFTPNFLQLLKDKEIGTLNGGRYLLFEFPMSRIYNNTFEVIYTLINKGYIPVLAHPERYSFFQQHPEEIEKYLRMGVLLQGNIGSLFKEYGRESKKLFKYFLKKKYYTFLGTDIHRELNFNGEKLNKKLLKITRDREYTVDILENNFTKVIKNEDIPFCSSFAR